MFLQIHNSVWRRPNLAVFFAVALAALAIVPIHLVFAGTEQAIATFFGWIAIILIKGFGWALTMAVYFIVAVAQHNVFINSRAVSVGWVVVRDVMNMFFIIILLVIAIGTILRSQRFTYKNTIVKMIIMVIVVNFSKTICGFFIDASNVVMGAFVDAVKGNAEGVLMNSFGVQDMLQFADEGGLGDSRDIDLLGTLVSIYLAVFMLIISTMVSAVIVVILLGRIIALWILIILSPIAFVADILPVTQKYAGQWWQAFTKYLIVGPVLMFFFWLSLIVMSDPTAPAINLVGFDSASVRVQGGASSNNIAKAATAITTPQKMFDYMVAIGLLFATLQMAQSMGVAGGSFAGKAHQLSQGMLKGAATKSAGFVFDHMGGWRVKAMGEAIGHEYTRRRTQRMTDAKTKNLESVRKAFGIERYKQEDLDKLKDKKKAAGMDDTSIQKAMEAKDETGLNDNEKEIFQMRQNLRRNVAKPGQKIRPGVRSMMNMFLTNPGDFLEEFGHFNLSNLKRVGKLVLPKGMGGGYDPATYEEELRKKRVALQEAEDKRKTHVDDSTYTTRNSEIEEEEKKNARLSITPPGSVKTADISDIMREVLDKLNNTIGTLKGQEEEARASGDDPRAVELNAERIAILAERKNVLDAFRDYHELESKKSALQRERDTHQATLEDLGATSEERTRAQARLTEIGDGTTSGELKVVKDQLDTEGKTMKMTPLVRGTHVKTFVKESIQSYSEEVTDKRKHFTDTVVNAGTKDAADTKNHAQNAEIEELEKQERNATIHMAKLKAPSFFNAESELRRLQIEKMKGVDTEEWTVIASAMKDALERHDGIMVGGLLRKVTQDGNLNEILDHFGFRQNRVGMVDFRKKILQSHLGMGEQTSSALMADLGYLARDKNQWTMAYNHRMTDNGMYEETPEEDNYNTVLAEMSKVNPEDLARKGNRLAYGDEPRHYDRAKGKYEREFEFGAHGLTQVAMVYPEIMLQISRGRPFNKSAAQNFMTPMAKRQLLKMLQSEVVGPDFLRYIRALEQSAGTGRVERGLGGRGRYNVFNRLV